MTTTPEPTEPHLADPTAPSEPDPAGTTTLATAPTTALPQADGPAPAVVPDDAVTPDDTDLRRLPPPQWSPAGPSALQPGTSATSATVATDVAAVTVRRGPRGGTVVLGLLLLLVATYVLLANLTGVDLSLRLVGPPLVGAFGGVLLVVGLAGIVVGRLRR